MGLNQSRIQPSESDLRYSSESTTTSENPIVMTHSRYKSWLPRHPEVHRAFIAVKVTQAIERRDRTSHSDNTEPLHHESVAKFSEAINVDPYMKNLFDEIFLQVNVDPKWADPNYVVKDFGTFLHILDIIVGEPPMYYMAKTGDGRTISDAVGAPMYLVFDMLSNTAAAYDLFRYRPFNEALKALLDSWGTYLQSPASSSTLHSKLGGMFSQEAMVDLVPYIKPLTFEQTYVCPDPSAENKGFDSWDAFFTRKLQPNARPIKSPDDNSLIYNGCESTTLRYKTNVKFHDTFWLKDQNYSLYDMLGGDKEIAKKFVGGTVYQAYLGDRDYHRWHCPVNGTIVKFHVLPGSYYAALPDDGSSGEDGIEKGDPHGALVRCQPWLTVSSTRSLVFIQADNPDIGLICFIAIGLAEVSTCEVTVCENQKVCAGQELGIFHFGGSGYALVFGPQAKITFEDAVGKAIEPHTHYWVNTIIGRVSQNP
ncbi:phosphatidylserine decarboxylase [Imleria badia]|nr:phosphatidylserine decarboxylase [Imleria badia]